MSHGIKKRLKNAMKNVNDEIAGNGRGLYGRGLSAEGYAGGYRDCLQDVALLLNGVEPPDRGRYYWVVKDSDENSQKE